MSERLVTNAESLYRAALEHIAHAPCLLALLGEDNDDCGCPSCTATAALAMAPMIAKRAVGAPTPEGQP